MTKMEFYLHDIKKYKKFKCTDFICIYDVKNITHGAIFMMTLHRVSCLSSKTESIEAGQVREAILF